jgi:hypothetical protein
MPTQMLLVRAVEEPMLPQEVYWRRMEEDPPIDFGKPSIEPDWGVPSAPGRPAPPPARSMPHYTPAGRPVPEHTITEAKIRSDWGVGDIVRDHYQERGAAARHIWAVSSFSMHDGHAVSWCCGLSWQRSLELPCLA